MSSAAVAGDENLQRDRLYLGDSVELGRRLARESVHLILSDIPYGIGQESWDVLHANTNSAYLGTSPAQQQAGAVFRSRGKPLNGWSEADRLIPLQYYEWCRRWSDDWYRALVPGGSAFVMAGRRLQHRCAAALEDAGFTIKDMLGWVRPKAPHRAQRLSVVYERRGDDDAAAEWQGWRLGNLRPILEPILWVTKPYQIGSTIADNVLRHGVGAFNEDALRREQDRPDNLIPAGFAAGELGLHPTQKPVQLMRTLIELTTQPGQLVLDPFAGSGTTLVAARQLDRCFLGFERDPDYFRIATERLAEGAGAAATPGLDVV